MELPDCFTGMPALSDLGLAGNRLASVPPSLGALAGLRKLALHGNELESLPGELFSGLSQLQELWLQGNRLGELPPSITRLPVRTWFFCGPARAHVCIARAGLLVC